MGIALDVGQVAAFERYKAELLEWNQRFNLTGITAPAEIDSKHFLDSLSCLQALPALDGRPLVAWLASAPKAVDVGAGAGFPGVPLKIAWPNLRLTLVEATGKKCHFLRHLVAVLALEDVNVVHERAEVFGRGAGRAAFDLALARAVSRLPTLLEYTLPLLRRGGWLIAQKGQDPAQELTTAQTALKTLGGRLHSVLPLTVPGLEADRHLVLVGKPGNTPAAFPRRAGMPEHSPL